MKALEDNAAAASDKYKGKYLRITGRVSTIDSDCKYITVLPDDDEYAIIGIQCNTQNDKDVYKRQFIRCSTLPPSK